MKRHAIIYLIFLILCTISLNAKGRIIRIDVDGGIGPATSSFIERGIEYAEENDAIALIIVLNTPGGLLDATREITGNILESKVPVVVYVAPGGSRAGSAGVFITLSANVAAMAPGTNIGAAHPVGAGGEADSSIMFEKVTNDAAAFIKSIANKRNKNPEWAENTVRHSISSTETEALEANAIDFICPNIEALIDSINYMEVETSSGRMTIRSAGAEVEVLEKSWREELLAIISEPNIAYILLMIGIYGIMFELYSPGSIFPGTIGAISLILGAYSMQMLPINFAGLALIILGIILFIIEIKVTSYGMLTIGGIISMFLGSMMLIDADEVEFVSISIELIITVVVISALFFSFVIGLGIKAQFRKTKSGGKDVLIGKTGLAINDLTPGKNGSVKVLGEIWKASSKNEIQKGEEVIIEGSEGFTLFVRKK